MMRWIATCTLLLTAGCTSAPSETKTMRFDDEVMLIISIAGEGGALSEEQYSVSYQFQGQTTTFFEGVNPRDFHVSNETGVVSIKFCDGTVHRAQPIFLGPPRNTLIPLRLNLDCL